MERHPLWRDGNRSTMHTTFTISLIVLFFGLTSCSTNRDVNQDDRIPVIFDTDANNELDDQHAMAYLFFNSSHFNVKGVTVNATHSGGNIDNQYAEAKRIMILTKANDKVPLLKGADKSFVEIRESVRQSGFDGSPAVDFIIKEARKASPEKLIILAVGKLTNVALAVEKAPSIQENIRLVWLGSNYPDPGEYNQDNDTVAMNYLLNRDIPFEMVTVRYGKPSGSAAVTATRAEIEARMPGVGPSVDTPVEGRHGGKFSNFGDYSVNLFEHIAYYDSTQSRALFDMVAVAVVKTPEWGEQHEIPAPVLIDNKWVERPANARKITIWENFDKKQIMDDFYSAMKKPDLVGAK